MPQMPQVTRCEFGAAASRLATSTFAAAILWTCILGNSWAAGDEPQVGQAAPAFNATDSRGNTRSLEEFRGKTVVLEWTNADCPFPRKPFRSGNMQALQGLAREHGVVWLSV